MTDETRAVTVSLKHMCPRGAPRRTRLVSLSTKMVYCIVDLRSRWAHVARKHPYACCCWRGCGSIRPSGHFRQHSHCLPGVP